MPTMVSQTEGIDRANRSRCHRRCSHNCSYCPDNLRYDLRICNPSMDGKCWHRQCLQHHQRYRSFHPLVRLCPDLEGEILASENGDSLQVLC